MLEKQVAQGGRELAQTDTLSRNGHTVTLLLDGRVLVVSNSSTSVNVATAEVYTP